MAVGVVGLGLIGASFAKAYKESDYWVLAHDIDEQAMKTSKKEGFVDGNLTAQSLSECDLVIISLYPQAAIKYMEDNAKFFKKGGLVIDTCGTKRLVCEAGFRIAKENGFTFVGCHPMAGNKYSGLSHSKGALFNGAPMVVVPEDLSDVALIKRVEEALEPCGFGSYCPSTAEKHDILIAFTSQMAHLVSNAYIKSPSAESHKGFSAGSYKDMTRVAWLNPYMWSELFLENKDNLINEIDCLIVELNKYKEAMVNDDRDYLIELLDDGRRKKEELDGN